MTKTANTIETAVTEPRTLEKLLFDAGQRVRYGGPNFPHSDPPLPVSRLRIRVHCPKTDALMLPNGYVVRKGWSEIEIYSDQLEAVAAQVADADEPARLLRAAEDYDKLIIEEIRRVLAPSEGRMEGYTRAEVVALIAEGNPDALAAKKKVLATTPYSLEASYRAAFERDTFPLAALEVIEELHPPQNPAEVAAAATMAHAIATAVAAALVPVISQIDALTKGK